LAQLLAIMAPHVLDVEFQVHERVEPHASALYSIEHALPHALVALFHSQPCVAAHVAAVVPDAVGHWMRLAQRYVLLTVMASWQRPEVAGQPSGPKVSHERTHESELVTVASRTQYDGHVEEELVPAAAVATAQV
jgi:hypothetical protein